MTEFYNYIKKSLLFVLLIAATTVALKAQNADFVANSTVGCAPFAITFYDQSDTTARSWDWDFGNGYTSTNKNPQIIYSNPGFYTVKLRVTFANSSTIDVIKHNYIKVFTGPTANFSANKLSGCSPLSVSFNDNSTAGSAPINSWSWDYGNGLGSSTQNPSFLYGGAGSYNVSLIITDTNNCSASITKNSYIVVNPRPTVNFGSANNNACTFPHNTSFVNTTLPNASGVTTYHWDYGNGNTGNGLTGSTTYNATGTYNVRLVATNSHGCSDTMLKTGFVNIQDLKVSFTADKLSGCPPFVTNFTGTSTPNSSGNIYSWSFGAGKTSQAKDTSILFGNPGSYNVKLVVTTVAGCTDSVEKTAYITAHNKPTAKIEVNDSAACLPPLNAQFNALPAGAASYEWILGDGTTSAIKNPYHSYTDTGLYSVKLIVTATTGCTDTVFAPDMMKIRRPKAALSVSPSEGCAPLAINFSNTSLSFSPLASVLYRFKDGTTSSNPFPTKTYVDTGKYLPSIIITTDDGCIDSFQFKQVRVGIKPTADFYSDSLAGCRHQLTVPFINTSNQHPVYADQFEWNFGNGKLSNQVNPVYTYHDISRYYDITLVAMNNGCTDTMVRKNYIEVYTPTALFGMTTGGCNSDSFYFTNNSNGGHSFKWLFGDGDSAFSFNAWRIYGPGNYEIKMIAHDTFSGCYDTAINYTTVVNNNVPKFRSDTTVCTRQGIWFIDQTPGSAGWEWDFGTGQIYTGRNVFVTFDEPGDYTVKYSALINGCRSIAIEKDYLHVYGPKIEHLTSDQVYCPPLMLDIRKNISSEDSITFESLSIYDTYWNSKSYINAPDTIQYYIEKPTIPQDTGYSLYFMARDSRGCQNWKWDTIHVSRPYSQHTVKQEVSCKGSRYVFSGAMTDTTNIGAAAYKWDFADGNTTDSAFTEYTYYSSGTYPVKFLVTDNHGCTDTTFTTLNVEIKDIESKISASATFKNCPPFLVKFSDSSTNSYNGINSWEWSFGDGSKAFVQHPQKIFNYPGKFDISLKIIDTAGCTDSIVMDDFISIGGTIISYSIDTLHGCEPLKVKVNSTSAPIAADIRWDMGDLKIVDSAVFEYTYPKAGTFIPQAFISDSVCQYSLKVSDTIQVFKSPVADFNYTVSCFGKSTQFTNTSVFTPGDDISYLWDFGDGATDTLVSPTHIFTKKGRINTTLKAFNHLGCGISKTAEVLVPYVDADIKVQARGCANTAVLLQIESSGLGAVDLVKWIPGDGASFNNNDSIINYTYTNKGIYYPSAFVVNEYSCYDSASFQNPIIIGDDFAPATPEIHFVTKENNDELDLSFTKNSSVDFEKYILYKRNSSGGFDSIAEFIHPDDTLYTDAPLFNLTNNYTYKIQTKNFCGYYSPLPATTEHTTMELKAYTADDASYLEWTPYSGWPVNEYKILRLDGAGNFVEIKSVPGNMSEAYDSAIVCNQGYYYKIKAVGAGNLMQSLSDSSGAIPNYIPFVPPNKLLYATLLNDQWVELKWSESVGGRVPVTEYIVEKSLDGDRYFPVKTNFDNTDFSFSERLSNTDRQNYYYRTLVKDSCGYFSEPSNFGRTVVLRAFTDSNDLPLLYWTGYKDWPGGVDRYDIEILRDGLMTFVATVPGSDTSFVDNISDLVGLPSYCYRVTAYNKYHSMSNTACAPVKSRIFVPNAFRPNGAKENQTFRPKGMYISDFRMEIYNRWGQLLWETTDFNEGWDGTYKGNVLLEGAYYYRIDAKGVDGVIHEKSGVFVLVR